MSENTKRPLLEIKDLRKTYNEESGEVLKGICLDVRPQDFIAIMGRSGCGKTTFLRTLGLFEKPSKGEIYFEGSQISKLFGSEIADIRRRKMGFVFQNYQLIGSLTVRENVMLPDILDKRDAKARRDKTDALLERFGIEEFRDRYPRQLSGGQQQRVALCRALVNDPKLILGDEPTGNLDSKMGREVIETLTEFNEKDGKTVILVTHDAKIAMYCRKVVFMKDGIFHETLERGGDSREDFYRKIMDHMETL